MSREILLKISSVVLLFVAILCGVCAYIVSKDPSLLAEEGGNTVIIGCAILSGIFAVVLWFVSRKTTPRKNKQLRLR